jgi:sensor histidine kinase YesM
MNLLDKIINFNKSHRFLSHLFFWLVIFLIALSENIYYYNGSHDSPNPGMALMALSCLLGLVTQIIAAYFLSYFIIPDFLNSKSKTIVVFQFLFGAYLICVLARFLQIHILEPSFGQAPKSFETMAEISTNVSKLIFVYFFRIFSVAFVFVFLKLVKEQGENQKRTLLLEKQKTETELKLLKTQLNPHFLFNTLNNIYSLSMTSSPATSASIAGLSDILDHILYRCNEKLVPLSSEITLLNNYINLEKIRYDERLQVNFNTAINQEIKIAPLILLSIVENAFKHGAGNDMGNPVIDINLTATASKFKFIVSNSCNEKYDEGKKNKIGLHNLEQQLELIYPQHHQLKVDQNENRFIVTLIINLKPANE